MNKLPELLDGDYPFMDERHPLREMTFGTPPAALVSLILDQAARSGTSILRDEPVELRLAAGPSIGATFLVFWPSGENSMYMLMPKRFVVGKA